MAHWKFVTRYPIVALTDLPHTLEGNIRGIKRQLQDAADKKKVAGKVFKPTGALEFVQPNKDELVAFIVRSGKHIQFARMKREQGA